MKTCKQIKLECAHDFMNDWKEWYYYILDVMFKNMESNNPVHETKTKVWANNVLKQKFNHILSQHVLCKKEMEKIYYDYLNHLDDFHNKVLKHILDKNKV